MCSSPRTHLQTQTQTYIHTHEYTSTLYVSLVMFSIFYKILTLIYSSDNRPTALHCRPTLRRHEASAERPKPAAVNVACYFRICQALLWTFSGSRACQRPSDWLSPECRLLSYKMRYSSSLLARPPDPAPLDAPRAPPDPTPPSPSSSSPTPPPVQPAPHNWSVTRMASGHADRI